jgi:hypothetical protein
MVLPAHHSHFKESTGFRRAALNVLERTAVPTMMRGSRAIRR